MGCSSSSSDLFAAALAVASISLDPYASSLRRCRSRRYVNGKHLTPPKRIALQTPRSSYRPEMPRTPLPPSPPSRKPRAGRAARSGARRPCPALLCVLVVAMQRVIDREIGKPEYRAPASTRPPTATAGGPSAASSTLRRIRSPPAPSSSRRGGQTCFSCPRLS